jgi:hypothetical protein
MSASVGPVSITWLLLLKCILADSFQASRPDRIARVSTAPDYARAESERSSTASVLMPTSSRDGTPLLSDGRVNASEGDIPLPSIEHGMENLEINAVNGVVAPPATRDRRTDSLTGQLQELGLGSRDSLSPGLQNGDSPRPRSHRRSSSRNPIQRHEVANEQPPESRFYSLDFQRALTQSRELATTLADALASSDLHNDESSAIHALHAQARRASSYSGPRSWKIGFVGDSGAGD